MPGSVANAVVVDSFPSILYSAFSESREFACERNAYRNGEAQTRSLVTASRRTWQLTARLSPTQLATLRAFYESHKVEAFNFTPVGETVKVARFAGPWQQTSGMALCEAPLTIVEIT
jgi:phage-related protein